MNYHSDDRLLAEVDLYLAQRDCEDGLRPPDRLRERVLGAVAGRATAEIDQEPIQVWKQWRAEAAPDGEPRLETVRGHDGSWEASPIAGIRTRRLAVDAERRTVTMMIEMAPGTSYPPHRHGGVEECYVLSGDLSVGGSEILGPGDYQRADAGSLHPVQSTAGGCTLLLVSSQDDELLTD